jgi:hypothetical protein
MSSPRYTVSVIQSKEMNGLTGKNGEEYCVLVRDTLQPLNSGWTWCATQEQADKLARILSSPPAED